LIYSIDIPTPGMEGYSPLHLAALGGRPSTVKLLKEYGADVDLQSRSDQQTPLHLAARYGHATTVIALLQAGCAPNPVDANGMT
ncbi:ankyrin, partial [Cadophora sp. DSE1049]